MLKYSLISLFFMVACGHRNNGVVNNETNDDTVIGVRKDTLRRAGDPPVINPPPSLSGFVIPGYTILDTASGDLNLDKYRDLIMVLKKNGEDSTSNVAEHPEKRPLLILSGQGDGTYKLVARNDNVVYCVDGGGMMGDPYTEVVIKKGYFSVEHYGGSGWRWTRVITFRYSPSDNNWVLHKDGGDSFHATDPEKVTTKVRTVKDFGKVPFEKFDIYKED